MLKADAESVTSEKSIDHVDPVDDAVVDELLSDGSEEDVNKPKNDRVKC